jgi:osmoprotectant transport system ATP-binding protein
VIDFDDVSMRYAGSEAAAVTAVSLTVHAGELIALLGESGSGKTTLVKMVNRLVEPTAGVVRVGGVDVRAQDPVALRRRIGYVIQHVGLFPHMSVADNVAVVPRLLGWTRAAIDERVAELLELVGLPAATYARRAPDQLSGGQRQRVGLARALAARPQLLLMDEPLGALDPLTRTLLQGELRRLHDELGLTTILVTHDLSEALTLADRVAVLHRGELRQVATPAQLLAAPEGGQVAELVHAVRRQAERIAALAQAAPPDAS